MVKSELIGSLKLFFEKCINLQKRVATIKSVNLTNAELKGELNKLSSDWFSDFSKKLLSYGIEKEILSKYDEAFKIILKLSYNINRKNSYIKQLDIIKKSFQDEIIIFMQTEYTYAKENISEFSAEVESILEKITDKDENEYLSEALGCWKNEFLKAAVVLAWCTAIDRIHKVIEQKGFDLFNKTSEEMKSQKIGRYKKFNKSFDVQSISELRLVFDSDILWILEGMKMIDTNQKTRLSSCFDMRCHSGHPGAAPITKYNVLSCFSDIIEIILSNPVFSVNNE